MIMVTSIIIVIVDQHGCFVTQENSYLSAMENEHKYNQDCTDVSINYLVIANFRQLFISVLMLFSLLVGGNVTYSEGRIEFSSEESELNV